MKRKPDALLLLALIFGLGLVASTVTHGGGDEAERAERMAASASNVQASLQTRPALNR